MLNALDNFMGGDGLDLTDPNAPASLDFILPSQGMASGGGTSIANRLLHNKLNVSCLRPYIARNGRAYFDAFQSYEVKNGLMVPKFKRMLTNDATLPYDTWKLIDRSVIELAKPRLNLIRDLESRGLVYNLPGGMAKTMIQQQQMSDISPATISMDGMRESESDRPTFSTFNFPLPLIHKDFEYSLRQILASRSGGEPLDTQTAALAGRRVGELAEQLVLGTTGGLFAGGVASYSYGGATVYGYMNHPSRITYSITLPTNGAWTPGTTIDNILAMKTLSKLANRHGPWMLYFGQAWDTYLDDDYKPTYNDTPLRQRIAKIDGIIEVKTADYLPGYNILMVEMDSQTVRLVKGMDITTIQWETKGGFQYNFKVICLIVPQMRTDQAGSLGIVHGS